MSDDDTQESGAPGDGVRLPSIRAGGDEFVVVSLPAIEIPEAELTEAEQAVARAIAQGLTNAQIAERRDCSRSTVANQIASIFDKFGVSSRVEFIAKLAERAKR